LPKLLRSEQLASGIRFRASTRAMSSEPSAYLTVVAATNLGAQPVLLEVSASFPVVLELYATSPRTGEPAWSQSGFSHAASATLVTLAPGETRTFETHSLADQILGSPLPTGRYYITALIMVGLHRIALDAGSIILGSHRKSP